MRYAIALLALCALTGCPAEPVLIVAVDGGDDDAGDNDAGDSDGGAVHAWSCVGLGDGLTCAPDRHCIAQRCVFNICGDGAVAGVEQCDDGNQVFGDDCTPSCRSVPAVCGDARVSPGEQCDDGNRDDSDQCSNACRFRAGTDAGTPEPLTADCPVLTSLVRTPFVTNDRRLVGRVYLLDAVFSVVPAYMEWTGTGGYVFRHRDDPFRITFQCDATGPQVVSLFTAGPNCTAVSHQVAVECAIIR